MVFGAVEVVEAQNSSLLKKALKKEYKTKMKQLKKEGWKIYGSSRSLDVALLSHYDKLDKLGENGYELMGDASKFKSTSVGKERALTNATEVYAHEASAYVKGRITNDMFNDADNLDAEFDKFYAAYEVLVAKEIKGELQESFSLIRDLGDGTFTMQVYFIVNENAASKARIRAMENALRESELAQKYAEQVSKFVRDGFVNE